MKAAKDGLQPRCRSCDREANAAWRKRNKEKRREYFAQPKFREARAAHKKNNRDQTNHHAAARRARLRGSVAELTPDEVAEVHRIYRLRDAATVLLGEQFEVDHIIPLALGGKHHPDNLQLLTAVENRRKGASLPQEV